MIVTAERVAGACVVAVTSASWLSSTTDHWI
jgi:hypothetical protein